MDQSEPIITGPRLNAEIEARKAEADRTLLRENLRLTLEERLLQLTEQARLAVEFDRRLLGSS